MIARIHGFKLIQHTTSRGPTVCFSRPFSATHIPAIQPIHPLQDWNLDTFRDVFAQEIPVKLPLVKESLPPACKKWFIHDDDARPVVSELRTAFWSEHKDTVVPLELTSSPRGSGESTFQRSHAPLKILLSYLGNPMSPSLTSMRTGEHSIYLAQCDLGSLPRSLRDDVPTPELVARAGRGDVYSSSLWLGRPPTYTPLHRDPNPNLFLQLAGRKVVRLFPPEVGDAVFEEVRGRVAREGGGGSSSARFRGEEMMVGLERDLLHSVVWEGEDGEVMRYGIEAELGLGEGLFIPKGWWHSVKGVGEGVTGSVNWWFR